jgi:hypothetical protein
MTQPTPHRRSPSGSASQGASQLQHRPGGGNRRTFSPARGQRSSTAEVGRSQLLGTPIRLVWWDSTASARPIACPHRVTLKTKTYNYFPRYLVASDRRENGLGRLTLSRLRLRARTHLDPRLVYLLRCAQPKLPSLRDVSAALGRRDALRSFGGDNEALSVRLRFLCGIQLGQDEQDRRRHQGPVDSEQRFVLSLARFHHHSA